MLKQKLTVLVAAAASALVISGCSSTNSHEPAELNDIRELVQSSEVWSKNLGQTEGSLIAPVVTSTGIYSAGGNELYRIDPKTGDIVWSREADAEISAGVGSDGHYIAVGTVKGEVEVYDSEGERLWTARLSSEVSVPPLVGSGFVFVRTADTRITAFDAASGERRWRYQSQVPSLTVRAPSQMRFSPAGVLVGQANGRLLALDGNGRTVFEALVAQPKGITEVERLVDVVGTPLVDANMPVVTIAPNDELLEKLKSNMQEVRARGGKLYVFADGDSVIDSTEDMHVIRLPENYGDLSPILHVVPLQLLAYHTALARGTDVDKPRTLAKSVTVE